MRKRFLALTILASIAPALTAQQTATARTDTAVARIVVEPTQLNLRAGDTATIRVTAFDANGNELRAVRLRVSGPRSALMVGDGVVKALRAGRYELVASAASRREDTPIVVRIPVNVTWPAIARVVIIPEPGRLYTGVTLQHAAKAFHADSSERHDATITWRSSNERVATVDRWGNVTAHAPGAVVITAEAEGIRSQRAYTVAANPVRTLTIDVAEITVRSGDVLHLRATARRANGSAVSDVPVTWS